MKRLIILLVGATALLVSVAMVLIAVQPTPSESRAASRFGSMSLPIVSAPVKPAKPPKVKFVRTIWTETKLADILPALDQCRGPVSSDLGEGKPIYVAEHDYCGGSAWMWQLRVKDAVRLNGAGVEAGVYVVAKLKYFPRHAEAAVTDLPDGVIVLQTCVSKTQMVFIALTKYKVVG